MVIVRQGRLPSPGKQYKVYLNEDRVTKKWYLRVTHTFEHNNQHFRAGTYETRDKAMKALECLDPLNPKKGRERKGTVDHYANGQWRVRIKHRGEHMHIGYYKDKQTAEKHMKKALVDTNYLDQRYFNLIAKRRRKKEVNRQNYNAAKKRRVADYSSFKMKKQCLGFDAKAYLHGLHEVSLYGSRYEQPPTSLSSSLAEAWNEAHEIRMRREQAECEAINLKYMMYSMGFRKSAQLNDSEKYALLVKKESPQAYTTEKHQRELSDDIPALEVNSCEAVDPVSGQSSSPKPVQRNIPVQRTLAVQHTLPVEQTLPVAQRPEKIEWCDPVTMQDVAEKLVPQSSVNECFFNPRRSGVSLMEPISYGS